jgi:hypothetical protein
MDKDANIVLDKSSNFSFSGSSSSFGAWELQDALPKRDSLKLRQRDTTIFSDQHMHRGGKRGENFVFATQETNNNNERNAQDRESSQAIWNHEF